MISLSHWGMFELSFEGAISIAQAVFDGRAVLWKSDDSGWLWPDTTELVHDECNSIGD